MRRMYEDVLRQMEQDSRDLFWHLVRATAPEKFWQPPLDVYETGCAFKIKVEVAGMRREDLHVDLSPDGRTVTVRGLRSDGDPDVGDRLRYHQMEIYTGPFERTVTLPANAFIDADQVEAAYQEGFLIITLPKRAKPRSDRTKIQVQG